VEIGVEAVNPPESGLLLEKDASSYGATSYRIVKSRKQFLSQGGWLVVAEGLEKNLAEEGYGKSRLSRQ
jgi:hypothetical protein